LLEQYKTIDDKYPRSISKDSFSVNHPSYLLNRLPPKRQFLPTKAINKYQNVL
jgi:hypothetical protein